MLQQNQNRRETTLAISPMQWAELKHSADVAPINETDYECLAEVREVLKKHNKRDRFGVALLHKHFDLEDDELLMEYINTQDRVLTTRPIKKETAVDAVETIWMLRDGEGKDALDCQQFCYNDPDPDHPDKCKKK